MSTRVFPAIVLLVAGLTLSPLASAFGFDSLKQGAGSLANSQTSGQTSGGGADALLGQMATGSLNLGSIQNAAGVLSYCEKQGYTQSATAQVKNKLLAKLGGQSQAEQSDSYQQGLSGILQGGQGQTFSLTNLKSKVGQRICGAIAKRAMSSFLGK